jgi:hypothetical protein
VLINQFLLFLKLFLKLYQQTFNRVLKPFDFLVHPSQLFWNFCEIVKHNLSRESLRLLIAPGTFLRMTVSIINIHVNLAILAHYNRRLKTRMKTIGLLNKDFVKLVAIWLILIITVDRQHKFSHLQLNFFTSLPSIGWLTRVIRLSDFNIWDSTVERLIRT